MIKQAIHTCETERALLVAQVGECCNGGDPFCASGCLAQKAIAKNLSASFECVKTDDPSQDEQNAFFAAIEAETQRKIDSHDSLVDALGNLIHIIDASGLTNLTAAVRLGHMAWHSKASIALNLARSLLDEVKGKS